MIIIKVFHLSGVVRRGYECYSKPVEMSGTRGGVLDGVPTKNGLSESRVPPGAVRPRAFVRRVFRRGRTLGANFCVNCRPSTTHCARQ